MKLRLASNPHFLLYGHGGCYNHGAEAITKTTIAYLKRRFPGCRISLSTHFIEQDIEFGLQPDEFLTRNMKSDSDEERYRSTLDAITPESVLIQVGGDNFCYPNWQRYAMIHNYGKQIGAKSIFWGCSIDEIFITDEMIEVLESFDCILPREQLTLDILSKNGLRNLIKVSDIAFSMQAESFDLTVYDNNRKYVVINISPLVVNKNNNIKKGIISLCRYILENQDYDIILLPHVMMEKDNDYNLLKSIESEIEDENRVKVVSNDLSASQYKYIISRASICVAARTHVTIAAYSSCVPVLAIGYSSKATGIAKDLQMDSYLIDCLDHGFEHTLLEKYILLHEQKDIILEHLNHIIPQYIKHSEPDILEVTANEQ